MGFWERTWQERGDAIKLAYGDTVPSGTVFSFSWNDRIRCPGACALQLPPIEESRDPKRHRRDDYLYLTLGLSQPLNETEVESQRAGGIPYSAHGIEFAFVVPEECTWAPAALYHFMTYQTDGERIKWGDRFPFRFHRLTNGRLAVHTGMPEAEEPVPLGQIRAVIFWPFLFPDWQFTTSTGKFMILVATGITGEEWKLAKSTTTVHLLLLLCRAGVAQRTMPERECLMNIERCRSEWNTIARMSPQECEHEIKSGIGRWHLAAPSTIPTSSFNPST